MKKGSLVWDKLGRWILIIILLVVVLLIIFAQNEKVSELIESMKQVLRFGGG
jgi:hypothetical protein